MKTSHVGLILLLAAGGCGAPPPPLTWMGVSEGPSLDQQVLVVPTSGVAVGGLWEYALPVGVPVFMEVGRAPGSTVQLADLAVEVPPGVRLVAQSVESFFGEVYDKTDCLLTLGLSCNRTVKYQALFAAVVFEAPGTYALRVMDRASGQVDAFDAVAARPVISWGGAVPGSELLLTGSSADWPRVSLSAPAVARPVFGALSVDFSLNGADQGKQSCWRGSCALRAPLGCAGTFEATVVARAPGVGLERETMTFVLSADQAFVDHRGYAPRTCPK